MMSGVKASQLEDWHHLGLGTVANTALSQFIMENAHSCSSAIWPAEFGTRSPTSCLHRKRRGKYLLVLSFLFLDHSVLSYNKKSKSV